MTNKLELDLSDPAMAEAVADCKPGETKTFSNVTVTVEKHDGKSFVGHVDEIEYAEPEGEGGEEYDTAPAESGATENEGNAIMLVLKKK